MVQFGEFFLKPGPGACTQTVLILIEQKLVQNTKIIKFNWDILGNFKQCEYTEIFFCTFF